jgi:hypothetical protein
MTRYSITFRMKKHYQTCSCSRNTLGGYRPIAPSKSVPELENGQVLGEFQTLRGFQLIQSRDFDRYLPCISACRPLKYCGRSCEIHSASLQKSKFHYCRRVSGVAQTRSIPRNQVAKPEKAIKGVQCMTFKLTKYYQTRSCSRNILGGYSPKRHVKTAQTAAGAHHA